MRYSLLLLMGVCCVEVCLQAGPLAAAPPPHVIVFIADDVSWNDFGCYGNKAARTPNIDALAAGGLRFDAAYLTASSCSPSRASIITGRYPHNNGKAAELHKPISGHLPWFPELLRASDYYTALSGKNHMSSTAPRTGPDARPPAFDLIDAGRARGNSGGHANWVSIVRKRPQDKPFFGWFASYDAHRAWDADDEWEPAKYGAKHDPKRVIVPPFLVDDAETRQDLASYYNEVTRFDYYVGAVVAELRRQEELDNTLIFVLADNGRPFPRAKTRLHDSGMRTALIAHWPSGISDPGWTSKSLVSVIDIAPTILSVAGIDPPSTMQGVSMLPLFASPHSITRRYAFSEHNWHDYEAHGRSVRDGNYLLVRNFRPYQAWQGPADSVRSPSHQSLQTLQRSGKLKPAQQDVFLSPRPAVELYYLTDDPYQLNNLADTPKLMNRKKNLLSVLERWMDETADSIPDTLSPDTFHRETGERLPKELWESVNSLTPGEDRMADHVNAAGPR